MIDRERIGTIVVVVLVVASMVAAAPASGQSATYDGEIVLQGDAADGTEYQYEIDDASSVSNYSVSLTGVDNQQPQSRSGTVTASGSTTISPSTDEISETATLDLNGAEMSYDSRNATSITIPKDGSQTVTVDQPTGSTVESITVMAQSAESGLTSSIVVDLDGAGLGEKYYSNYQGPQTIDNRTYDASNMSVGPSHEITLSGGGSVDSNYYGLKINYQNDTSITVDGSSMSSTGSTEVALNQQSDTTIDFGDINGTLDYELNWSETTYTRDPALNINGQTVGHSGTLADGETTELSVDPAWIESGLNNVSISTSSPADGPGSLVGLDYRHTTSGDPETITVDATTWTESINTSTTIGSDQRDATASLSFADNVVSVSTIETRTNGGSWTSPSSWSMSDSTLDVELGDVSAGDEIAVRAEGRKVVVEDGTIDVVEPTIAGTDLSTRMRVTSTTGSGVSIDVSGTSPSDKVHYLASSDWSAGDRARFGSDGSQVLELPNAVDGAEATVETAPLSISPQSGEAIVEIDDAEEPRFSVEPGATEGDYLEIGYLATTSGTTYELTSVSDDRVVDRGTASSPVWFSAPDDPNTFVINVGEASGAVGMIGAAGGDSGGLGGPLVLGIGMVGVLGSALVGRRVGLSWQVTLPVSIVAVVGIAELASPTSLVATISGDLLRGSSEPLVATVVGTALLGGLAWIDRRISINIPTWLYGGVALAAVAWIGTAVAPDLLSGSSQPLVALAAGSTVILGLVWIQWRTDREIPTIATGTVGALAAVWIAETIAPGVLADPLRAGLEEVGPLAWLAILGGGIYAIRGWIRSRNSPDTQVTLSLGGDES